MLGSTLTLGLSGESNQRRRVRVPRHRECGVWSAERTCSSVVEQI